MKRREFLKGIGASLGAALPEGHAPLVAPVKGQYSERPNFLVIMSDQHNPHVLGCYGDPIVKTPNLDALASRGVVFRHTYCQSPLCVPSRMAFLTGQQPSKIRVRGWDDVLCSDVPTFAHSLGAAGYDTTLIGRMNFYGLDQWHGFGKRLVGDIALQYPYVKWPYPPALAPGGENMGPKGVQDAGPGKTANQAFDEDVADSAIRFLREKGEAGVGIPFCAVVGFVLSHPAFVCSKAQWDYYYKRVSVPRVPSGYFSRLHPAIERWRKVHGIEDITPEEVRRARAAYYGLVTEVDLRVGRILEELEKHEFARNTVVIYTSDHGEMAGENGMWFKLNFYEGSVTVPLIMSAPGRWASAQRREITSLIDVGPTMLEIANAAALPDATGSSLLPLLNGGEVEWVSEAFSELPADGGVPAVRMVRSGRWKLVHFDGERPQLFDLKKDPHEYNDLATEPACSEIRETLAIRAISQWSAEEVRKGTEGQRAAKEMMRQWAMKVRPPLTAQWVPPPGANQFPEDE